MVDPAAVNVQPLAQVLDRHRRALQVPPRKAHAPRTVPLHQALLVFGRELPEREVRGVALLVRHLHAMSRPKPAHVQPRQLAVVVQLRRVEVHAVSRGVRVALLLERANRVDLLGDVVSRLAPDVRLEDVEMPQVVAECLPVEVGDLPDRLALAPGADGHLVLAIVCVGHEVPHVGDVHDVPDLEPAQQQRPLEHVLEHVRPQVADVRVVVHGRPACVEANRPGLDRLQLFLLSRQRVVNLQAHTRLRCLRGFLREVFRVGCATHPSTGRPPWRRCPRPAR